MKKILALVLALCMLFALAACGQTTEPSTSPSGDPGTEPTGDASTDPSGNAPTGGKIAVLLPTAGGGDQFWTGINNAAEARGEVEKANGYEIAIYDALSDAGTQIGQAEDAINQGVAGICLAPADPDSGVQIAQLAKDAGIPIVVFNRQLTDMTNVYAYCGLSEKETVMVSMEALCEQLGGKGKIGQITGISGHSGAEERKAGIEEVAAKYPEIEIFATQDGKFKRENAMNITLDWLQAGQEMDAIVAPGSEMAIGVAMAVKEYGLKPGEDILILAFDATGEGIRCMLDGETNFDSYQDPNLQVNGAVDLVLEAITSGEEKGEDIWIAGELVTPETVVEFAQRAWPEMYAEWEATQA